MESSERAAYVISQAVCAMAEIMGMVAENQAREQRGEAVAYPEEAFAEVVVRHNLAHNDVLATLAGG